MIRLAEIRHNLDEANRKVNVKTCYILEHTALLFHGDHWPAK